MKDMNNIFYKSIGKFYDDFECCVFEITANDVINFVKNVIRKYSNFTLESPTVEQVLQAIEYLLLGIVPNDEIIRESFTEWIRVNKPKTLHYEDIIRRLSAFYDEFKINTTLEG